MRILIANPNMTGAMTDLMVAEARRTCRPGCEIVGLSADFGVSYIATRSELAIAGHALLDSLARHHKGCDAVVVGAFCHGLVAAAKELMPIPVIGIAEAALRAAQLLGRRIAIIGIGARDRGANEEIISDLGMTADVVAVRRLALSGTELANHQARADDAVVRQGALAVDEDNADVLVLGGAAFSGMAERIAARLPVPVVSPVPYAVGLAELAVISHWRKPSAGTYSAPGAKPTLGLGDDLAAFFAAGAE